MQHKALKCGWGSAEPKRKNVKFVILLRVTKAVFFFDPPTLLTCQQPKVKGQKIFCRTLWVLSLGNLGQRTTIYPCNLVKAASLRWPVVKPAIWLWLFSDQLVEREWTLMFCLIRSWKHCNRPKHLFQNLCSIKYRCKYHSYERRNYPDPKYVIKHFPCIMKLFTLWLSAPFTLDLGGSCGECWITNDTCWQFLCSTHNMKLLALGMQNGV